MMPRKPRFNLNYLCGWVVRWVYLPPVYTQANIFRLIIFMNRAWNYHKLKWSKDSFIGAYEYVVKLKVEESDEKDSYMN